MELDENSLAGDLLRGAKPIGDFIGEPDQRRVYYIAEKGYLPIGKEGALLVASKRALRAHYDRLTQGAAEVTQPPAEPHIGRQRAARSRAR